MGPSQHYKKVQTLPGPRKLQLGISVHEVVPNDRLCVTVQVLNEHSIQVTWELLLVEDTHPPIAIAAAHRRVATQGAHLHGVGQRHL